MSEEKEDKERKGYVIGGCAILGAGVGAAIGVSKGDVATGTWIGSSIGIGLGLLAAAIMGSKK